MTLIHYTELIRNDASGKVWLTCYQTKVCTETGVSLSVRMWRIEENGRIVRDYLLKRPRRKQIEKYI